MAHSSAPRRREATGLLVALSIVAAGTLPAAAQGRLTAQYTITMTGIAIGHIAWRVDIGETQYTTSAGGKASGVLSMLVNGEGAVKAQGAVAADGRLAPAAYSSDITDEDGATALRINFTGGTAKETISPQRPHPDRLPVTDADRRGVADPLTAVLLPAKPGGDPLTPAACLRRLSIFDGERRYNLALSYGRMETFKAQRGYAGPALVCGVVLEPIAGYRADSLLVKYVGGKHDMELWFAPIEGTNVIAPIEVLMPTLIGTLKIEADQFESKAAPVASPAPAPQ